MSPRHLRALPQGEMPELLFFLSLLPLSLPLWPRPWERFPQGLPARLGGPGAVSLSLSRSPHDAAARVGRRGTDGHDAPESPPCSRQETPPCSSRLLSPTGSVKDRTAGAGRGRLGSRASSEHRGLLRGRSQPCPCPPRWEPGRARPAFYFTEEGSNLSVRVGSTKMIQSKAVSDAPSRPSTFSASAMNIFP